MNIKISFENDMNQRYENISQLIVKWGMLLSLYYITTNSSIEDKTHLNCIDCILIDLMICLNVRCCEWKKTNVRTFVCNRPIISVLRVCISFFFSLSFESSSGFFSPATDLTSFFLSTTYIDFILIQLVAFFTN